MSKKILVTDSLFIFDEHIKKLKDAGYEVERLDTPKATEEELVEALQGKMGYILGGIERVTDKVIESTDNLRAIAFTGSDYQEFIPGWRRAKEKGIEIFSAPGANASAVSEFAITVALMMERNLLELGRTGERTFQTTGSFKGATIGVIGSGHIGQKIIKTIQAFDPKEVQYFSRNKKDVDADYAELNKLLSDSDIIFVAVPSSAGQVLDTSAILQIKRNALVISISPLNTLNTDVLLKRLQSGTLRAAIDWPAPSDEFKELPLHAWFNTNDHTAFNTKEANQTASDAVIDSLIRTLNREES